MQSLQSFFIPSFTSTSVSRNCAFSKSCLMVVKMPHSPLHACTITEDLSKFHADEQEVLLASYAAMRWERMELVNGKKYITLAFDDGACGGPII